MQPAMTLLSLACGAFALSTIGCIERDPYSASDVAAADAFHSAQAAAALRNSGSPASGSPGSKVRCRCDAEGGLHVEAPQGAKVRVTETNDKNEDAEAEIDVVAQERRPGTRIRGVVSLGFIGDNKLTESVSRGGPWNVPDGLLPAHAHGMPDRPQVRGGYGGYGYRGYTGHVGGYGSYGSYGGSRSSGSFGGSSGGGSTGGHNINFSAGHSASAGGGPRGGSGGTGSSGRGPR